MLSLSLIRHVSRKAAQAATAEQRSLATQLAQLESAHDWLGVVALEHAALALALDLRGPHPAMAGAIHGALGRGFAGVGQYARALELHAEDRSMSQELGDRAGVVEA